MSDNGRDPVSDYDTIVREIALFNGELLERKQLVVASKIDVLAHPAKLEKLEKMCRDRALPCLAISAVTGAGIKEFVGAVGRMLDA
jgi:GTP-binding protein